MITLIFRYFQDFKLEWFIPDSSYVRPGHARENSMEMKRPGRNEFFVTNDQEFATGTPITVNLLEQPDAFASQDKLLGHDFGHRPRLRSRSGIKRAQKARCQVKGALQIPEQQQASESGAAFESGMAGLWPSSS